MKAKEMKMTAMPAEIIELAKPAINKRIGELIDAAFKLAQYTGSPETLEKAIDESTTKYFSGNQPRTINADNIDLDSDTDQPEEVENTMVRQPRNLVDRNLTERRLPAPRMTGNNIMRRPPPTNRSYAPGKDVQAARYSDAGRPRSQYHGVTYSGSITKPWLVRYGKVRIGVYRTEEEAAQIYDRCRVRSGKDPLNFK